MFEQLGLIGCGLMGGSFALALKRAGLVKRVVGYSKSPSTTERARQMGVIDVEAPSALLAVSGADIVLVAVPVSATEATFKAIKHLVTPQMLIMDVGSTKREVIDAGRRALREHIGSFVPAHPIAGKEVSGVENADADLYAGRQVVLTPIDRTNGVQLQQAIDVWAALGCRVVKMSPESQMDYVKKYFQPYKGKLKTLEDVYMAILYPAAIGKPSDAALFKAGTKVYEQNKGFDKDNDGVITPGEVSILVRAKYSKGMGSGFQG